MAQPAEEPLYLGLDLSTQQLKAILVTSSLVIAHTATVSFDNDLTQYGTQKGVLTAILATGGQAIVAPVVLWLEALDLALSRLQSSGADLSRVRGVSGAGMQHGTVYWSVQGPSILASLNGSRPLAEALSDAFSRDVSPNWQDASTQAECEAFDRVFPGGRDELAAVTGSSAHHRFSGPQILRWRKEDPKAYEQTSHISLISSFLASIFLGKVAPIDLADVTGMNLWDIRAGDWHQDLLALCGGSPNTSSLRQKLGSVPTDSGASLATISPYFTARYGFSPSCAILPFTGDNPSTILSLPLRAGDAILSLGTSTTFLMSTPTYNPSPAYHFMNHPTTPGLYMFMLCYKNGALAREQIRDRINALSPPSSASPPPADWTAFNTAVTTTPPLSAPTPTHPATLALYFPLPEIVPPLHAGEWRFSLAPPPIRTLSPRPAFPSPLPDARAILESQFLSVRRRAAPLVPAAARPPQPTRLYLAGGASVNPAVASVAGAVLGGAEGVFRLARGENACALGAAYKAAWGGERRGGEAFEAWVGARWREEACVRRVDAGYQEGLFERYGEVVEAFGEMEERVGREVQGGA